MATAVRMRFTIPLLLLTSLVHGAQQTTLQTGSIEGTVVDAITQQPLANVSVSLFPVSKMTTTDSKGSFVIESVEAGQRRILAQATGYSSAYLTLTITAGERAGSTSFRMSRRSAISGRVLDSRGQPAVGASVSLLLYTFDAGSDSQRAKAGQANTTFHSQYFAGGLVDDQGNFRIFNVDPGEYYVRVAPPPGGALGVVLYPGVTDRSNATPVRVEAGADLQLPTVTLGPSTLSWITVRIVDVTGEPRSRVTQSVSLHEPSSGYLIDVAHSSNNMAVRPDFPGTYLICAHMGAGMEFNNCVHLDYNGSAMNLEIRVGKPEGHFSGRVLIKSSDGTSPKPFRGLYVTGRMENQPDWFNFSSQTDGGLILTSILPYAGRGQITGLSFLSTPGDYYVESAKQGNRDVLIEGLLIPPNAESPVEIVVSAAGGILSGKVTTANGESLPHAVVVLVPQGELVARSDRGSTYRTGEADQNGVYEIRALVPGPYRVYAASRLEGLYYWDPTFMQRFEESGKNVRVEKGGKIAADLKVIE